MIKLKHKQSRHSRLYHRKRIFQDNRRRKRQSEQILEDATQIEMMDKVQKDPFQDYVDPNYKVIIETCNGFSFKPVDILQLISRLFEQKGLENYRCIIGLSKLSCFFKDLQTRQLILRNGIILKIVIAFGQKQHPFLQLNALQIFLKVSRDLVSQVEYARYINKQTLPFNSLIQLLKSQIFLVVHQALIVIKQTLNRDYQLETLEQKNQLIKALPDRLSLFQKLSGIVIQEKIIQILQRILYLSSDSDIEQMLNNVCFVLIKLSKSKPCVVLIQVQIQNILISQGFIRAINSSLKKNSILTVIEKNYNFAQLFEKTIQRTIQRQSGSAFSFFDSLLLLKYLSNEKMIEYFERMGLLGKFLKTIFLDFRSLGSFCQEMIMSWLTVLERLLTKKHQATMSFLENNPLIITKMRAILQLKMPKLTSQFRKTISKVVSTANMSAILSLLSKDELSLACFEEMKGVLFREDRKGEFSGFQKNLIKYFQSSLRNS